jgi:hypothetical protein
MGYVEDATTSPEFPTRQTLPTMEGYFALVSELIEEDSLRRTLVSSLAKQSGNHSSSPMKRQETSPRTMKPASARVKSIDVKCVFLSLVVTF